jgi:hypothetical protein
MSEMGPLPEQPVCSPRIPLSDLRNAIRLDHKLPPLGEPEPDPPPRPRHYVQDDPWETPMLHGGRAAYLIPLILVVAAWQMNEHAGMALSLVFYGAWVVMSISRDGNE